MVMNASSYLLQTKPQSLSTWRLQHSIKNNMLHPNNSNNIGTKNKNLVLDVNCEQGETTRNLQDIFLIIRLLDSIRMKKIFKLQRKNFQHLNLLVSILTVVFFLIFQ